MSDEPIVIVIDGSVFRFAAHLDVAHLRRGAVVTRELAAERAAGLSRYGANPPPEKVEILAEILRGAAAYEEAACRRSAPIVVEVDGEEHLDQPALSLEQVDDNAAACMREAVSRFFLMALAMAQGAPVQWGASLPLYKCALSYREIARRRRERGES